MVWLIEVQGKSTLMKLLLRLYDPTEGTILVNGQDIRTLKIKELRSCVATLFQDFTIFPFSVGFTSSLKETLTYLTLTDQRKHRPRKYVCH
jgi:ABC-type bacteriocin/lantibiotic exporter with double-glycine peptidase domain